MILRKMSLTNFRQFKDTQEIVFAEGKANKPCITVLYGENGRGKTGIFRALMFGLYGDSTLSQDTQTKKGELNLVNRHLIEESVGKVIKAAVYIEFTHNGASYNIRREISGMKEKKGTIIERLGEALLQKQGNDGNTNTISEPKDILQEVNSILDKGVREYFLFDGEKIERLTRASSEQKKEVSAGIRNLLNIDDLEKSIRASEKLCRDLDKEVKKKSTGELQQVINEINEKEDLTSKLVSRNDTIEDEIDQMVQDESDKIRELRNTRDEIIRSYKEEKAQFSLERDLLKQDYKKMKKLVEKEKSLMRRIETAFEEQEKRALLESLEVRKSSRKKLFKKKKKPKQFQVTPKPLASPFMKRKPVSFSSSEDFMRPPPVRSSPRASPRSFVYSAQNRRSRIRTPIFSPDPVKTPKDKTWGARQISIENY